MAALAAGVAFGAAGPVRAEFVRTVVMSGLANPRGLAVGPDGAVYVAEAGTGGTDGAGVPLPGPPPVQLARAGRTGGVSRWTAADGQLRVLSDLPSIAGDSGEEAAGLQDLTFGPGGTLYGVFGLGADPALRAPTNLGDDSATFGRIVQLDLSDPDPIIPLADVTQFEADNPGADGADSNPYALAFAAGRLFATDAGANRLVSTAATGGAVTEEQAFAPRANTSGFGPPFYQAVPTAVAADPTGQFLYVAELTGFPFPVGEANVYQIDVSTGDIVQTFGGFTTISDLAVEADGSVLVLEYTTDGIAAPPSSGRVTRLDPATGSAELLVSEGLDRPTGIAAGPDGSFFVSNVGPSPTAGEVLRFAAVPEPGSLLLAGLGAAGLAAMRRRVR